MAITTVQRACDADMKILSLKLSTLSFIRKCTSVVWDFLFVFILFDNRLFFDASQFVDRSTLLVHTSYDQG